MYSRDDCAVLTNFDERFGDLRSVLSVNRKNLFAYCACLPTYLLPTYCSSISMSFNWSLSHSQMLSRPTVLRTTTLCSLSTKRGNVHSQSSETHVHTYDARVRLGACCLLYIMVHVPRQQRRGRCCPWPHSLHACMHSLYSAVQYRRSGSGGAVAVVRFDHYCMRMYTHPSGTSPLPVLRLVVSLQKSIMLAPPLLRRSQCGGV